MSEKRVVYAGRQMSPLDEGRRVAVSGFEFVIPELVLGERERLEDEGVFEMTEEVISINRMLAASPDDPRLLKQRNPAMRKSRDAMIKVVVVALKRNYPDADEATVKNHFNQSALVRAYAAAVGVPYEEGGSAQTNRGEAIAAQNGRLSMDS